MSGIRLSRSSMSLMAREARVMRERMPAVRPSDAIKTVLGNLMKQGQIKQYSSVSPIGMPSTSQASQQAFDIIVRANQHGHSISVI